MNTGHIKSGGAGPIDPRPGRLDKPGSEEQISNRTGDSAAISEGGRETSATVDAMVDRLKAQPDRREHVEAVRSLLESGSLDQPEVFQETARKMLMDGV